MLWNLAASAEKRKDAVEAREIVLALPNNPEISEEGRIAMVREFAEVHFVSKGIPVQIDIHRRPSQDAPDNPHAHLLIATRRLSADGFSSRKAVDLEPQIRHVGGRRLVVEAEAWGKSWLQFQDDWFARHATGIKVDAIAPIPGEHLGPKRLRNPFDPRLQEAARRVDANSSLGHAPQRRNHRQLLQTARLDQKFGEVGSRPLTARDVAQELSSDYGGLRAGARRLNGLITKATQYKAANETHKAAAQTRLDARWRQMGIIRKAAHLVGSWGKVEFLRDIRIDQEEKQIKRSEWGFNRWSIRRTEFVDRLASVIRQGRAAFEAVRPGAEEELRRRQKIATNARKTMDEAAGYVLEHTQTASRGMRP